MSHHLPYQQNRIFTLNEPNAPRLNPALACEIGLNESIILLQLEFWIAISNNAKDGMLWTYQSTRDMKITFPFWSHHTINRAIASLEAKKLIISTTKYNNFKYDKTRWFTLNFSELQKLESISIKGYATRSTQIETGATQIETGSTQIETAPPSYPVDITRDSRPSPGETTAENNLKTTTTTASATRSAILPETTPPPSAVSLNESLKKLTTLVPEQHQSEMVSKLIEKELKTHSVENITSSIYYANAKSKQNYKAFLGKTISNGWAEGYKPESAVVNNEDEKYKIFLESRRKMPTIYLKLEAENGCKACAQVLKERAERDAAVNNNKDKSEEQKKSEQVNKAPAPIPNVISAPTAAPAETRERKKGLTRISFAGLIPPLMNGPRPTA